VRVRAHAWVALMGRMHRMRFTLDALEVVAPAYEHFQSDLARRATPHSVWPWSQSTTTATAAHTVALAATQVATASLGQYFVYERSRELVRAATLPHGSLQRGVC
jgi:hypothetical protein